MAEPTPKGNETESYTDSLSAFETLRLNAVHAYYSISKALRFDKVAALLQRAHINVDVPVHLLGHSYVPEKAGCTSNGTVLEDLVLHFHSIFWLTYRNDFAPLSARDVQLRTDVGWGCTLRSIQMIAAQALQRHVLGPDWRWSMTELASIVDNPPCVESSSSKVCAANEILRLFWDVAEESSPFSIHNICRYGEKSGVFPGRWIGPWTGCRALEAAATSNSFSLPGNLAFKVLGGSGGGAPLLPVDECVPYFKSTDTSENENENENGLVLLFPLVLGLGKLNPVYIDQILATFRMPQSLGIVGGRPDSSLYFVGAQGGELLYLDPHQVQQAATGNEDWWTFRCDVLRTLYINAIDPSLALGFYCKGIADFNDLCLRLSEMESTHICSPLICVRKCAEGAIGEDSPQRWEDDEDEDAYFTDEKSVLDTTSISSSEDIDVGGSVDGIIVDEGVDKTNVEAFVEGETPRQTPDALPHRSLHPTVDLNGGANDGEETKIDSENLLRQASSVRSAWELI